MGVSKNTLDNLQKRFGKGVVMKLSDEAISDVEFMDSGSLYFNYALGGGFPKGRVVELYGPESSGKTTVALMAIAEEQKNGGNALVIDAEHAFNKTYAKKLGVDTNELLINQPDSGEQALDLVSEAVKTGEFSIILVDSTNALTPQSEIDGEVGDANIGVQARLLSKSLRKISQLAKKHNCLVIFISQLRENIGPYGGLKIGVGNAMKFYASQRAYVRGSKPQMEDGKAVGHDVIIKLTKNKVAPPHKECRIFLRYGKGYDKTNEVVVLAEEMGIIQRKGSWYSYEGENLAQGLEKTTTLVNDNPELHERLKEQVLDGLKQQDDED